MIHFCSFGGGIPIPAEIKAYWKFDQATGNVTDVVGGLNLVEQGTVPSTTGVFGTARGKYSTSNYFKAPANASFQKVLFACEGFVNISSSSGAEQKILHNIDIDGWTISYGITGYYSDKLTFNIYRVISIAAAGSLAAGWHHWGALNHAISGTNECRLYIDGAIAAQTTGRNFTPNTATYPWVGRNNSAEHPQNGYNDDMAIWDLTGTGLTADQIGAIWAQRWNGGNPRQYAK